jgi:hypothetical protein
MCHSYSTAVFPYRVKNTLSQSNTCDPKGNKEKAFVGGDAQTHQQRHRCWFEKLSSFHNASSFDSKLSRPSFRR